MGLLTELGLSALGCRAMARLVGGTSEWVFGHSITIGETASEFGVVDTGCGPNGNLGHVTVLGSILGGHRDQSARAGEDVDDHGSHVTGLIGARPRYNGEYAGVAPGCHLYHIRVFEKDQDASSADIAAAIDILSQEYGCDLINLSLTASEASEVIYDAILDQGCSTLYTSGGQG